MNTLKRRQQASIGKSIHSNCSAYIPNDSHVLVRIRRFMKWLRFTNWLGAYFGYKCPTTTHLAFNRCRYGSTVGMETGVCMGIQQNLQYDTCRKCGDISDKDYMTDISDKD